MEAKERIKYMDSARACRDSSVTILFYSPSLACFVRRQLKKVPTEEPADRTEHQRLPWAPVPDPSVSIALFDSRCMDIGVVGSLLRYGE